MPSASAWDSSQPLVDIVSPTWRLTIAAGIVGMPPLGSLPNGLRVTGTTFETWRQVKAEFYEHDFYHGSGGDAHGFVQRVARTSGTPDKRQPAQDQLRSFQNRTLPLKPL